MRIVAIISLATLSLSLGCSQGSGAPPNRSADSGDVAGGTSSDESGSGGGAGEESGGKSGIGGSSSSAAVGGTRACIPSSAGGALVVGSRTTACSSTTLPSSFSWKSTGPLLSAIPNEKHKIVSVKDPTVVFFNDKWHVYATAATTSGSWNMVYVSFFDWSEAASATPYYLNDNVKLSGYHCAPQLFYFTPQKKWYLVYQSGPPQFSTADDPSQPATWTAPQSFYAKEPAIVTANKGKGTWLDFWVICDAAQCYMFFADDNGHWYRSVTTVTDFPKGFGEPIIVLSDTKENVFEASNVYKLKGSDKYLALIEAFGPTGNRYFRSWTADKLDGDWTALADSWVNPFAGKNNVTFDECVENWTTDISHGEMIRDGYDETMTVNPCNLQYLYQGVVPSMSRLSDYSQIPWQLGILTQTN